MPESRGRTKKRGPRYQLEPQKKQKRKPQARWYTPLVLGLIGVGIVMIIWNYMRGDNASNAVLFIGLGVIGVGFIGTTQIR